MLSASCLRLSRCRICAFALITCCVRSASAGQDGDTSSNAARAAQLFAANNDEQPPVQVPAAGHSPLYLTLQDAISMALKNNLYIQLQQLDRKVADFSVERAKGGGTPRAINYNVAEPPLGQGTAVVPLFSTLSTLVTPTSVDPSAVNISSSYSTGPLTGTQRSLSLAPELFSAGSPVPAYDPQLLGQLGWMRRDPAPSLAFIAPSAANAGDKAVTDNTLGSFTLVKGFSSGTSVQLGVNNFIDIFYSGRSSPWPFSHPNAFALATQPLLRGANRSDNTRYIAIAKTNRNISITVLEQQMINTISGVANLYYDLVSLQQAVGVQQEALQSALELYNNTHQQFLVGRMPSIELSRAEALESAVRLGLLQARALEQQQEIVLRSVIDPQSLADKGGGNVTEIVATDPLSPPANEQQLPLPEIIELAWKQRPDLRQARLQISNGERMVAASQNEVRPEVDLYGEFESRGVLIPGLIPLGGDPTTGAALLDPVPVGGIRGSRVYEAGIQFNLPLRNRVAAADLGADITQLRQQRLRLTQMEAQVSAEVRNAMVALNAARMAAEAAATSRKLQEQLLSAEVQKFQAGFSTNFNVIQQQAYLAQSKTTEVVANAAWLKAVVQLDRALGETLEHWGISLKSGR